MLRGTRRQTRVQGGRTLSLPPPRAAPQEKAGAGAPALPILWPHTRRHPAAWPRPAPPSRHSDFPSLPSFSLLLGRLFSSLPHEEREPERARFRGSRGSAPAVTGRGKQAGDFGALCRGRAVAARRGGDTDLPSGWALGLSGTVRRFTSLRKQTEKSTRCEAVRSGEIQAAYLGKIPLVRVG